MKKTLLFIAGAMLLTTGINAQITLNSSSYPVSVLGTDSLKVTTAASTFPTLTVGTNEMWDLSTVTDSSAVLYAYRVNPDTTACEFADSDTYNISTASYQGNVQSSITSGGLMQYGIFIPASTQTVSIATVDILNQHAVFTSQYTVIGFPATMGSTWSSNYQSVFNVVITSPALGAGAITSNITETDTVTGWGQMRVKDMSGSPSLYFDVLQVKSVNTTINTFSGSLTTLASTESIPNPDTTITYSQNYYRTNEVTPFANVVYTNGTFSTPSKATTHIQRLQDNAVPSVLNNADVQVYPNPVTAHLVSIDVPAVTGEWSYELVNVLGQKVAADILPLSNNQTHTQLQLSNTLITGMYYIRLINGGRQVAVKPLEIN